MVVINIRTDFLDEVIEYEENLKDYFVQKRRYKKKIETTYIKINKYSKKFKAQRGEYIAIEYPSLDEKKVRDDLEKVLTSYLNYYFKKYLKKSENKILVFGLGNRYIASDSLGPLVISHIEPTNHLDDEKMKLAALAIGVMGQTGIESFEVARAISSKYKPDLIILIDNLATSSIKRLNKAIQLNDIGIDPGSGVYNNRKSLNRNNLKVPVITIGVASVIEVSKLVYEALKDNYDNSDYDEYRNLFVTLKSIDMDVNIISNVIARSINKTRSDFKYEKISD